MGGRQRLPRDAGCRLATLARLVAVAWRRREESPRSGARRARRNADRARGRPPVRRATARRLPVPLARGSVRELRARRSPRRYRSVRTSTRRIAGGSGPRARRRVADAARVRARARPGGRHFEGARRARDHALGVQRVRHDGTRHRWSICSTACERRPIRTPTGELGRMLGPRIHPSIAAIPDAFAVERVGLAA